MGHASHGEGIEAQLKSLGIADVASLLPLSADDACEAEAGLADAVFAVREDKQSEGPRLGVGVESSEDRPGLVVTEVDVSPDLRNCAVYYYCTGENPDIEAVQAGLESATGLIRKEMSSASSMRYTPKLVFKFDAQIDAARRIEDLLSKLEPGEES